MKILVTGASGFLGSHVVARFVNQGHTVAALLRATSSADGLSADAEVLRHDGTTTGLIDLITAFAPAVVIHMATRFVAVHGSEDVDDLIESNIGFGCQLLEAMTRAGVSRLVNFGTSWQNFNSETYVPASLYAATKEAFETILAFYVSIGAISSVTLRLSDTYGPGDNRPKLINLLTRYGKSGDVLDMSPGEQRISLVHSRDVADAVEIAVCRLDHPSGKAEVFSVRGADLYSLRQFVEVFEQATGLTVNVNWGTRPYRDREIMTPWTGPLLPGWTAATPLHDGLREVL